MQLEMPLFQVVGGGMADITPDLVQRMNSQHEAVGLCMRNSRVRRTIGQWAKILGVGKGTLALLLNGGSQDRKRYFPPEMVEQIQLEAGNRAVSQWWEYLGKGMLYRQRSEQYMREAM